MRVGEGEEILHYTSRWSWKAYEAHFVAFRLPLARLPLNNCWCTDFSVLHYQYVSSCTSCMYRLV